MKGSVLRQLAGRAHVAIPFRDEGSLLEDLNQLVAFLSAQPDETSAPPSTVPARLCASLRPDHPVAFPARQRLIAHVPAVQDGHIEVPGDLGGNRQDPSEPPSTPPTAARRITYSTVRARRRPALRSGTHQRPSDQQIVESSAVTIAQRVREGTWTAEQVAEAYLARVREQETSIRAFVYLNEEEILRQARVLDKRQACGQLRGGLAGVPVALKDSLCTTDAPTTCASHVLLGRRPWRPPYDATVVTRLREADALLFGKTNMDELSMGSSTETSAFGATRNPWAPDRVAGGSSGGSAAAVAAQMTCLALGSDAGGSIRQPAAFNHLVGLRPTYGTVSRFGLVAFASSFDQVGPMARDVAGAALLLRVISGLDPRDQTTRRPVAGNLEAHQQLRGLRIGVLESWFERADTGVARVVRDALSSWEQAGATLLPVELRHAEHAVQTYQALADSEASSNLARFDGTRFGRRVPDRPNNREQMLDLTRGSGFGPEVRRRILAGTLILSSGHQHALYKRATTARAQLQQEWKQLFSIVDVIVSPTTPSVAWRRGDKQAIELYVADQFTAPASLGGLPAISVPCGLDVDKLTGERLPVGLQIVAPQWRDEQLLSLAHEWETRNAAPNPSPGTGTHLSP